MKILFRYRIRSNSKNSQQQHLRKSQIFLSLVEFFSRASIHHRTNQLTRERVHRLHTHTHFPTHSVVERHGHKPVRPSISPHNRSKPVEFRHREAHRADSSAPTAQSSSANLMRTTKSCGARPTCPSTSSSHAVVRAFVRSCECFAEVVAWD